MPSAVDTGPSRRERLPSQVLARYWEALGNKQEPMHIDPGQITIIRHNWAEIASDRATAARLFYGRLFGRRQDLRALFGADLADQERKLMDTLNFVVDHLDQPDALLGPVRSLGMRHHGYGVADADYDDVGAALIWTFQNVLGDAFDTDAERAWTSVYQALAAMMIQARA